MSNTFAQDGRDLLHACARGGNEDLVKWLVQEFEPPIALTKVGILIFLSVHVQW